MSTIKFILKDLGVMKIWSVWTRRYIVSTVVRRCIRDRGFRDVILRFKHTILRQRRTLMLAATAAYKNHSETPGCEQGISDDEMQTLVSELENVQNLAKMTLYCTSCGKRLVIDKKHTGVRYCVCKDPKPEGGSSEGWVPYMETEDVIIWRKEYKPGKGLYAYKVYGRYPEVQASDFAAVQIDGAYRRVWDSAVAALAVVQTNVSGIPGQAVLHWEVLWPRLFANRDYVYIRRHKEYDIKTTSPPPIAVIDDNLAYPTSVHAKAKRKSMQSYAQEGVREIKNKVYIILNKSCEHPKVPETKHAIRVNEYWSHMVVKTVDGTEKPGMEFVLTYYDEPAVGGMPGGVAAWASSRAAPLYLERMRRAATDYRAWAADRTTQELPDFIPFGPDQVHNEQALQRQEQDMESSKRGPDLENGVTTRDQSSQTDAYLLQNYLATTNKDVGGESKDVKKVNGDQKDVKKDNGGSKVFKQDENHQEENIKEVEQEKDIKPDSAGDDKSGNGDVKNVDKRNGDQRSEGDGDKKSVNGYEKESKHTQDGEKDSENPTEEGENNGGWWRYLYPFYYFV
ncbi:uncharacterized protein LOC120635406 isoform X1 [Pararge aegeria]|uniref:uncharacterized protein LOC120635406 isoform X1 n=1 Tax=Pararge aegeria TaxID=116150 RepID=UPI0019D048CD|nr:uncharacterized protein LOC120635406 isoform X1 [Pararge aegeria]